MADVLDIADLPGETSHQFEGYRYSDVHVSFFVSATPLGGGPKLHKHPYAEVFVVQAGNLTFIAGDETIEASSGQIIIVPAGVQHKFTNTGSVIAHHVDIHTSGKMETTWLED